MSKSIDARDIKVSMLFNLLLPSITILLSFSSFFLVTFNSFFIISVVKENTRVKDALAIPAGIPITLVKEIISPDFANKKLESCQYNQKQQCIY